MHSFYSSWSLFAGCPCKVVDKEMLQNYVRLWFDFEERPAHPCGNIEYWDVSNVTDMADLFSCTRDVGDFPVCALRGRGYSAKFQDGTRRKSPQCPVCSIAVLHSTATFRRATFSNLRTPALIMNRGACGREHPCGYVGSL